MTFAVPPWSPYEGRTSIVSSGRKSLTSAFAEVVKTDAGFESHELPAIFAAPEDGGPNDAARDLVRLNADDLTKAFASGQLATFARPWGGGEIARIASDLWELDDPLPRFATGVLNLERWADHDAPPTHRIFVDDIEFDSWLAALKPLGPLTNRELEEIFDPQLRATRAIAKRKVERGPTPGQQHEPAALNDPPGVGPLHLNVNEVSKLIGRSRSSIYEDEKKGVFPRRVKLGSSARWRQSEVLAWVEEQAAKRGER